MRQKIKVLVSEISASDFVGEIDSLIEQLEVIEEEGLRAGLTDIRVEHDIHSVLYDDREYAYLHVYGTRLETDEEMAKRISKAKSEEEARERRDRKEFERLSQKFGQSLVL